MTGAVVLAGSLNDGLLRECSPVSYEALIPIGSRMMVEYVCDALLASAYVEEVVVVGPEEQLSTIFSRGRIRVAPAGKTVLENVQIGIKALSANRRVLVVTSDIPLITAEAIDDFIKQGQDQTVDFYYPIVARSVVESRFPGVKRTYISLKEGIFTGGNLFLVNPDIFLYCLFKGEQLVKARKNPWQLARLVGIPFFVKFLAYRLSLKEAQAKVSKLLGIKGVAVISHYPEVGFDIDKPNDLELAMKILCT